VRPRPGFASATALLPGASGAFSGLLAGLRQAGYVEGTDLFAHPYDFRLSPLDWAAPGGAFDALKADVEAAVAAAGRRPLVAVALSLGAPFFNLFLSRHVTAGWKAAHVAAFVSLSGLFEGAPTAVLGSVAGVWGDEEGAFWPGAGQLRPLFRALPVLSWIMPSCDNSSDAGGGDGEPLAYNSATRRRWTAGEAPALLEAAGAGQAARVWRALQSAGLREASAPPGVRAYCLYGAGLPTVEGFAFSTADFSGRPSALRYGDGDGTVPARSLARCAQWAEATELPGMQHAAGGMDRRSVARVLQILAGGAAGASR
jgi:lysophospholipase-3